MDLLSCPIEADDGGVINDAGQSASSSSPDVVASVSSDSSLEADASVDTSSNVSTSDDEAHPSSDVSFDTTNERTNELSAADTSSDVHASDATSSAVTPDATSGAVTTDATRGADTTDATRGADTTDATRGADTTDATSSSDDTDTSDEPLRVVQLAAGWEHTCALLSNGRVRCWGKGANGTLGYADKNTIGDDEVPAAAGDVDVGGTVTQLAAGGGHTCALLTGGRVRCWGGWDDGKWEPYTVGQLGYGNTDIIGDDETPASAGDVGVGGVVTQLAAGGFHTCALLEGGSVRCWGSNTDGQLGYGNTNAVGDDETPGSAGDVDVGGVAIQLAAGARHTCALLMGGWVRCWGDASFGQLGYGNEKDIGDDEVPAAAGDVNVGGAVTQLAASEYHTCALLENGRVRCWGYGFLGRLGYGNTNAIGDDEHPASAGDVNVGGAVTQLAAGWSHTCALLENGRVRCWGLDKALGYGNTHNIGDDEHPAAAGDVNVGGRVIQLAAGASHTCALLENNQVRCWGDGARGKLGYGNTDNVGFNEAPATAGDVNILGL